MRSWEVLMLMMASLGGEDMRPLYPVDRSWEAYVESLAIADGPWMG